MIDRLEILMSRVRYLVSRNRWSARLLGFRPVRAQGDDPGLILIQVDGLGEGVLERALAEGRMPFTRHLIEDEGHRIRSLYSGMGSNTPNFQAELFYGVRTCVPGFGFRDVETGRSFAMNHPDAAKVVEERLRRCGEGLLRGGSAWCDIYTGGADEPHFCASTTSLGVLLRAIDPGRVAGLVVWHGWSVVRVVANFLVEIAYALWGFVRGAIAGRNLVQELRFIPERVFISAVMREIVTAGACIDAERGLPIIHVNLLGYDEHAHRRGPDSGFALWTLKGIDRSIRRIWLNGHRSRRRDYQTWIYSDHGQERVQPYVHGHGHGGVTEAVLRAAERVLDRPPEVVHRGPVGFVYVPDGTPPPVVIELAGAIAREADLPTVLVANRSESDAGAAGEFGAFVWTRGARWRLPEDRAEVFGADHPHLDRVTEDTLALVRHESAGSIVLFGWSRDRSLSFKHENGAHGGPGVRETSAFLIHPRDIHPRDVDGAGDPARVLRPSDLRELCLEALDPARPHVASSKRFRSPEPVRRRVRVMTYNVHGCRGMDGRYSVRRIARVIASAHPDVVCLQELDQVRTRSGAVDQVHEIAALLETEYHFHPVVEVDDGRFGNAVLSHYPSTVVRSGALPRLPPMNLVERGALWVEVDVDGLKLQVLNTHLSIFRPERHLQVDALVRDWLTDPRLRAPLLLAGDLNASLGSPSVRKIETVLRNISARGPAAHSTWSGRFPVRRIDHVFADAASRVLSIDVPRTRLSRVASDHLPLVVDLEIRSAGPGSG